MAGWTGVRYGGADIPHKRVDGMLVEVFDLMESLANVEKKSYHGIVGSVHGRPWLMKQGKDGGRTMILPFLLL